MNLYYVTAFGLSFYIVNAWRKRKQGSSRYDFRFGSWRLALPLILGSLTLLYGLAAPIMSMIPMSESMKSLIKGVVAQNGIITFAYFVLAGPLVEELIFRGIMLDGLLRRYRPLTAILVSSLLFGFVHLNPWQFVSGFVLGCFAGWVYYRSGSISACFLIHMAANLSGYILRLLASFNTLNLDKEATSGGGVMPFVAYETTLLIVCACSIYLLRREFNKPRYITVGLVPAAGGSV